MKRLAASVMQSEVELKPIDAFASSAERGDLGARSAIDGNDNSRWGSGFTNNEWLALDFGKSETINRVRINWENARATEYKLQVSDDKDTWKDIKHVTGSTGGVEDITGLNGQGRYLRVLGIQRNTNYGYSIFEIQAFSGGDTTPPPTEEPPPPTEEPQVPVDPTKPGVLIKPATASSNQVEGPNSAAMAIDGKPNTRWSSVADDKSWIQFDFGQKTQVGYMKLTWENAYGKEYTLLVSDDEKEWKQIRAVNNGQGGIEEFFNLNVNARFIKLQGAKRATNYGYSLFEVEFKTPGNDNSLLPLTQTSAIAFPLNGAGMQALPSFAEPLEVISFKLPDGRLVTRWGARGVGRHGRERGEEWNEVNYGPNETVDAAGRPYDKGPGDYLKFVPNYFKNRTWGLEIIDDSTVPGNTKPTLVFNEYHTTTGARANTVFFRRFDDPGSTGYGWMVGRKVVQDNDQPCAPVPYATGAKLLTEGNKGINNGCTLIVDEYPRHSRLNAAGFPDGTAVDGRNLKLGDVIEVAPSMFADKGALAAKGDNGGNRYYANEWVYQVGKGIRPWYGIQPRLNSIPIPEQYLQGGSGSVSYDYADNGDHMFQQPFANIGMQNMQRFSEGRRLLHTNFTTGMHNEPGNDRYDPAVKLQGQHYNQSACIGCHVNNGRSPSPFVEGQRLDNMTVRVAVTDPATGKQVPHPLYGTAVQMNAVSPSGAPQNWGIGVKVGKFETKTVKLADGTSVELRKPLLAFEGQVPETVSLRSAQPMLGAGLLEAIPEADIIARARTTPDADGVKGVANYVYDTDGTVRLGRFGWKAAKATLRQQAASALLQDMAVTSPDYPNRACLNDPVKCKSLPAERGVSDAELNLITQYLQLVSVPAQRALASGFPKGVSPLPDLDVDEAKVAAGTKVFSDMRCAACHTVQQKTGSGHLFAELRNQTIKPYTDLLLHDMGEGLADNFVEGQAKGNMWRTAPLWGIGYTDRVMGPAGKAGYLHDGRARTLTEAIMWHGGEAEKSRQRFEQLSQTDREALLAFLKSL